MNPQQMQILRAIMLRLNEERELGGLLRSEYPQQWVVDACWDIVYEEEPGDRSELALPWHSISTPKNTLG